MRRIAHPVHGVDHLPRVAALQGRDHQRLVLGGQREHLVGIGTGLVELSRLDPQGRARAGDSGTDLDPPVGLDHGRGFTTLQPAHLDDGGLDAVRGVPVLQARRNEEDAVAVGTGRVDRGLGGFIELDGHHHAGQHHEIGQEEDGQASGRHTGSSLQVRTLDTLSAIGSMLTGRLFFRIRPRRTRVHFVSTAARLRGGSTAGLM